MKMENYKNKDEVMSENNSGYGEIIGAVVLGLLLGCVIVCGIIGIVQTFC